MVGNKVERYTCGNGEGMFDNKKGYWVTYEDYKALLNKYEKLVKESDSIDLVSKCACPPLVACEICGEEKNLDGDFWKNKK